jgi:hypothetical protein
MPQNLRNCLLNSPIAGKSRGDGRDQRCVASQAVRRSEKLSLILAERPANGGLLRNWPPVSEFRFWSLSQTVLARREQFHQSRLVEHLGSWNPFYNDTLNRIQEYLNGRTNTGSSSGTSMAIVNQMVNPSHDPRLYRRVCCAGRNRRGDGAAGPDVAHGQSECWCETRALAFATPRRAMSR